MPTTANEFAINASNYRHWDAGVRLYIDDCLKGERRPAREATSTCAGSPRSSPRRYRILMRGGVFLYPGDARQGYRKGRLRLVYEANPIAFCIEQAGGSATDGASRILDLVPEELHQRTPLVFGSAARGGADRPLPRRTQRDRRALAAVRQPRPVSGLSEANDVSQAPDHRHHRFVRRRHHFGQAHLRADLPARERRGRLHRGRCIPPLRPRGDEGEDAEEESARATRTSPISAPRPTNSRSCRRCSRNMGARARAGPATTSTTTRRRRRYGVAPGTFTAVARLRAERPAVLRGPAWLRGDRDGRPRASSPT